MLWKLFVYIFVIKISFSLSQVGLQQIAIISTNDIHGSAIPINLYNTATNQTYKYGGAQYLAKMIQIIQKQYKENVIYLDAGDQVKGAIQSSDLVSSGKILNDFYNAVKLDGSAIGNHQFDFPPQQLFNYWKNQNKLLNLAANLISETNKTNFLPGQKSSIIYTLKNNLKIGVIGLITQQTSIRKVTRKYPRYKFLQYPFFVIQESKKLRKMGANAVVILSHIGNDCESDMKFGIWQENTKQNGECSTTDEISTLIKAVPKGTIDAIIQGHRHKFSHHFIQGIPVSGVINGGTYFNVMYLRFYNKKLVSASIEGPIPVCQKVFAKFGRCQLRQEQMNHAGELVEWKFHGVKVEAHPVVEKAFEQKWMPILKKYQQPLAINHCFLEANFDEQNVLGNLITNLLYSSAPDNDFVIMGTYKFRYNWPPGIIDYTWIFHMFPNNYPVVSFNFTGEQLINTLKIIQSGSKAFYQTYGLHQKVMINDKKQKSLISVNFQDGRIIQNQKIYRGITLATMLNGSGDFKNVIGKVFTNKTYTFIGNLRDILATQIKKIGIIRKQNFIDPNSPRLQIIKK